MEWPIPCLDEFCKVLEGGHGWDILLSLRLCNLTWYSFISQCYTNKYLVWDHPFLSYTQPQIPLSQMWLQAKNRNAGDEFDVRYERLIRTLAGHIIEYKENLIPTNYCQAVDQFNIYCRDKPTFLRLKDRIVQEPRLVGMHIYYEMKENLSQFRNYDVEGRIVIEPTKDTKINLCHNFQFV